MALFDGKEKELEAQLQKAEATRSELELQVSFLQRAAQEQGQELQNLRSKLNDIEDIPVPALSLIQLFIRCLGAALLVTSLLFARHLGTSGAPYGQPVTIWGLYLFSQFGGLYLAGFGTPTSLRSLLYFGVYMSTLLVVCAVFLVLSVVTGGADQISQNLILLTIVNSLGIPVLIHVERRTTKRAQ